MKPDKERFSEERKRIARGIVSARKSERLNNENSYGIDKSGKECLYRIGGLKYLFEYLRTLSSVSNKVLDIGVGNGRGSSGVISMPISSGLHFEVTALRNTIDVKKNLAGVKLHITSVEALRGVENNSLAGVIGINSVGYSDNPLLAVKRLNEVLVPGGVFKGTFYTFTNLYYHDNDRLKSERHNDTFFKSPEKFIDGFLALGYDVAVIKENRSVRKTDNLPLVNSVLIAIKPGNPSAPTAEELLESDFNEIKSEAVGIKDGWLVFDDND